MEEKVYIEFDLTNEEMIREALTMPEVYGNYFIFLLQRVGSTPYIKDQYLRYEDENMVIFTKLYRENMVFSS